MSTKASFTNASPSITTEQMLLAVKDQLTSCRESVNYLNRNYARLDNTAARVEATGRRLADLNTLMKKVQVSPEIARQFASLMVTLSQLKQRVADDQRTHLENWKHFTGQLVQQTRRATLRGVFEQYQQTKTEKRWHNLVFLMGRQARNGVCEGIQQYISAKAANAASSQRSRLTSPAADTRLKDALAAQNAAANRLVASLNSSSSSSAPSKTPHYTQENLDDARRDLNKCAQDHVNAETLYREADRVFTEQLKAGRGHIDESHLASKQLKAAEERRQTTSKALDAAKFMVSFFETQLSNQRAMSAASHSSAPSVAASASNSHSQFVQQRVLIEDANGAPAYFQGLPSHVDPNSAKQVSFEEQRWLDVQPTVVAPSAPLQSGSFSPLLAGASRELPSDDNGFSFSHSDFSPSAAPSASSSSLAAGDDSLAFLSLDETVLPSVASSAPSAPRAPEERIKQQVTVRYGNYQSQEIEISGPQRVIWNNEREITEVAANYFEAEEAANKMHNQFGIQKATHGVSPSLAFALQRANEKCSAARKKYEEMLDRFQIRIRREVSRY